MTLRRVMQIVTLCLNALALGCDSDTTCEQFCSTRMYCTPPSDCTFVDRDVTKDACVEACNAGLDRVPAMKSCFECAALLADSGCQSWYQCPTCWDYDAMELYWYGFEEGFYSKAREEDFLCTNGKNFWLNNCGVILDEPYYVDCSYRCASGWEHKPLTVSATCTGPEDGPLSCACTVGKNAGATFEVSDCGELYFDEPLWTACNL